MQDASLHTAADLQATKGCLQGLFPGERFAVGDSLQTVAVADVNGEGVLDLITASNEDGTVSVLLDRGDGSFEERGNSLFT